VETDPLTCFPGAATVRVEGGGVRRMDELAVGDRVDVGRGRFSPVFMFTHRAAAHAGAFVRIEAASGAAVRLTAGHYVHVNGALAPAAAVRAGDAVELAGGARDVVVRVSAVADTGLYNPQTLQGDVVVDGVLVSTYTTAVEPAVAHALLAPLRAVYAAAGVYTAALEAGAPRALADLARRGRRASARAGSA
jgi:hypothetical protein